MSTVRKILGKKGRVTIPYEYRQILDMNPDDVITFSMNEDRNCVVITKDKVRNDRKNTKNEESSSFEDYLSGLPTMDILEMVRILVTELTSREASHDT